LSSRIRNRNLKIERGKRMEKQRKNLTKWGYWLSLVVSAILIYKLLDNLGDITSWLGSFLDVMTPFLIGILIAYILYMPCKKMEELLKKTKKGFIYNNVRPISVVLIYIITLILIVILMNFILPPVIESIVDLTNNFQSYYNMVINEINSLPEDSFWKTEVISNIMNALKNFDLKQFINIEAISQYAQGAISLVNGVIDTFVAIIVSSYILISRKSIIDFLKKLTGAIVTPKAYQNIERYFNRSNKIFFNFIASQLLDAVIVGIITSIAMAIMGIKYAPLLGFMIGLFNMIPYVGAIIAVIIAAIITFFTGGLETAIWMIVVVTILQQIDANIINPRIIGNSLKINPLLVMFAITIGGEYFGIIGMFLAVPVIAIIKVLVTDFIDYRYQKSKKIC